MTEPRPAPISRHAVTFIFVTVLLDMVGFGIIIPVLPKLIGDVADWQHLESFLPPDLAADPETRRSGLAGTFAATLELVRQGRLQMRQLDTFGPIYLRRSTPGQRPGVVTRNSEAD